MNKQTTEQLKKEFEEKFTYVEQNQDPLTGKVYRHREFNPNNLITIVEDVWNFFLPHLASSDEIKREAYKNCIRIIKAQTFIRTDLGEVATKDSADIETLGRNIVGAIENQYLTQSKEGKINT